MSNAAGQIYGNYANYQLAKFGGPPLAVPVMGAPSLQLPFQTVDLLSTGYGDIQQRGSPYGAREILATLRMNCNDWRRTDYNTQMQMLSRLYPSAGDAFRRDRAYDIGRYCNLVEGLSPSYIRPGGVVATVLEVAPTLEAANATLATLATAQTNLEATTTALAAEQKRSKMYMYTTAGAAILGVIAYAMKSSKKR